MRPDFEQRKVQVEKALQEAIDMKWITKTDRASLNIIAVYIVNALEEYEERAPESP